MIPGDVVSQLQNAVALTRGTSQAASEISDKLAGLVAGQKVVAEIQGMLPNGTYRAVIAQRNVTLALPFAAKSGDSLELLVTESDGKLALAVTSAPDSATKTAAESASATLSRTGQLISDLFADAKAARGAATPLNEGQPLTQTPPTSAQALLPSLKQAIEQSGMFYESHQAEWVEGRLPQQELLKEPQGRLSSTDALLQNGNAATGTAAEAQAKTAAGTLAGSPTPPGAAPANAGESAATTLSSTGGPSANIATAQSAANTASSASTPSSPPAQIVSPSLQPIVQQQLEALASQHFVWQGQVWPGQTMRWEIDEDASNKTAEADDTPTAWSTRLHLVLPSLGEIDARIRLQGNQLMLTMAADSDATRDRLRTGSTALRSQLDQAGLALASMGFEALDESPENAAPGE